MGKKTLEEIIKEMKELGFDETLVQIAYSNVDGKEESIFDEIFRLQNESTQYPTKPSNPQDEDAQLSKAIEMSINEAKDKKITLEPLNPEQRVRKAGVPVGLKNIGNTCYFNSILQTYFQNVEFVKAVLRYQIPEAYKPDKKSLEGEEQIDFKRKQASCRLVENLKLLFTGMIASDRRYLDPTDVVTSIVDDYGNELPIGDQKDIGEFNLVFLSRIDEGLQLAKKPEMKSNEEKASPSKIAMFGEEGSGQHRLLQRSSIKIEQNSLINQQFIGTMENFYINEGEGINKSEDEQFSLLFVNIKNQELYKALEAITIQHIDDYRNDKGEVVGVEKQSWIKVAPKTLFFQIDRVVFNKETCQLQKINDEFDFPTTFFIDPFLLKNKEQALLVQKKVRKLRNEKEKYSNALRQLEKFGNNNLNLLDLLGDTTNFLESQKVNAEAEDELENPVSFPTLAKYVTPEHIDLLKQYRDATSQKINNFHSKITEIEKEIESCYSSIKTTPYHLYSLLIHEGSADSGHYYSYTYDLKTNVWRKFNDINISEEVEQQVVKEARGVNYTSAYYLVYTQEDVLVPSEVAAETPLRNYEISSNDTYMTDFYSSLIPNEQRAKVKLENAQMYQEIEQYKMGAFANRVVDSYTKKFEVCNEGFRKTKGDKKKNSPPNLTNLPIYIKNVANDDEYKTALIESAITEFGPKQPSPIFEDLLKKKMANFNDFKKPTRFNFNHKYVEDFMRNVYKSLAAKKIFEALKNGEYKGLFSLIKELKAGQADEYFSWLMNLLCKILVVTFLIEAEKDVGEKKYEEALEKLKYLAICFTFVNIEEEKALLNSCNFWLAEIDIKFEKEEHHAEVSRIIEMIHSKAIDAQCEALLTENNANALMEDIKGGTDLQDAIWNLSRQENTFVDSMLKAREEVKGKMEVANELYREMKKKGIPLSKQERDQILIPK